MTRLAAAAPAILAGAAALAADGPKVDAAALDQAFEALKTYDWGAERKPLVAIDEAVVATRGDAAARKALEARLAAALKSDIPRDAKDNVCRTLKTMGTADSVPALASLLENKELSHMARYALERIPAPEAAAALRDALAKTSGAIKAGVAGSLGARRDNASVSALAGALGDGDKAVARAAACALGHIGNAEAGKALADFAAKAPEDLKQPVADARLTCAERLLADGKKAEATAVYKSLSGASQPDDIRKAALRGMLKVAGKQD
ncbi:MAG: HEAT repeat domain-containing protein [Pirellulales bacterium]